MGVGWGKWICRFLNIEWLKNHKSSFNCAILHVMRWKYKFNIIRKRWIQKWIWILDISIAIISKLLLKNLKMAKNQSVPSECSERSWKMIKCKISFLFIILSTPIFIKYNEICVAVIKSDKSIFHYFFNVSNFLL